MFELNSKQTVLVEEDFHACMSIKTVAPEYICEDEAANLETVTACAHLLSIIKYISLIYV